MSRISRIVAARISARALASCCRVRIRVTSCSAATASRAARRHACGLRVSEEGVEERQVPLGAQQPLMLVLSVEIDEGFSDLAEEADRCRRSVDQHAARAGRQTARDAR
jgi:hypothetical protein